jgi:GrpB-like predicted nucleotidyltransferase (UPF0157 family)
MPDPVVVTKYDSGWPTLFSEIAAQVRRALGEIALGIEHVGSTAVPGLSAKPVIDIDVVVRSTHDLSAAIKRLETLGYRHEGDKGVPGRESFEWPSRSPRHHLYLVVEGSQPHQDHIRFRDYLRTHPEVARDYADLKEDLAAQHRDDRDSYTNAKEGFIATVLAAANRAPT